jgi:sentrin-specific protease 8
VSLEPPGTLLVSAGADDAKQQAEALRLAGKALILFAVNDNPFADVADGGMHWTLLAYTRGDHTFRHLDSGHSGGSSSSNDVAACGIAAKLAPVLG